MQSQGYRFSISSGTLPAPSLNVLARYGFTLRHRIKPHVFEQGAIFRAAGSSDIFAETHFPVLLRHMKEEAAKRGDMYYE